MIDGPGSGNGRTPEREDTYRGFPGSMHSMVGKQTYEIVREGAHRSIAPTRHDRIIEEPGFKEQEALVELASAVTQEFEELLADQVPRLDLRLIWADEFVVRHRPGAATQEVSLALCYRIRDARNATEYLHTFDGFFPLPGEPTLQTACASLEEPHLYALDTHFSARAASVLNRTFAELIRDAPVNEWSEHFYTGYLTDICSRQVASSFNLLSIHSATIRRHNGDCLQMRFQTQHGEYDISIAHNHRFQNVSMKVTEA